MAIAARRSSAALDEQGVLVRAPRNCCAGQAHARGWDMTTEGGSAVRQAMLIATMLLIAACDSEPTPTRAPLPTLSPIDTPTTAPFHTAPPSAGIASPRCYHAPSALIQQLNAGLTAYGDAQVIDVYVVDSNDDRPWRFIGGHLSGPGLGIEAVWATASLDLDNSPLLVAAESMAAEFSIWDFPNRGESRFDAKYNDEITVAGQCAAGL